MGGETENRRKIINDRPNAPQRHDQMEADKLQNSGILTLYHGNKNISMVPAFGMGEVHNDYGQGFYTTPDKELGKEWAWGTYTRGDHGFLHVYTIDIRDLNLLDLTKLDSVHWIAELLAHRTINFEGKEVVQDTVSRFNQLYKLPTDSYDIIIGYRADDSYFRYAEDFASGLIYKETLETALRYGYLGLQVFIKSRKAFSCLQKVGVEEVPEIYKQKYTRRDRNARQQYEMARTTISVRRKQTIFDLIRDGA